MDNICLLPAEWVERTKLLFTLLDTIVYNNGIGQRKEFTMEKKPRITIAFDPKQHQYITVMAAASGLSINNFIKFLIGQHMEQHKDKYAQALKFRDSL